MKYLKVRILHIWDTDRYPGWAECIMIDAFGVEHRFRDKIPVFYSPELTPDMLPCDGIIRCVILNENAGIIQIDTKLPDQVESITGEHIFFVSLNQLLDNKEVFS